MDGRILECNQAFADMLGYSKKKLKNLTYQQLTPKRWHQMEAEIVKEQILKRDYSDEYEKEYIRKDGTVFPVSARVWLVRGEDGKPVGMWGIVRDITERKKAKEAFRKAEEKERLAREQERQQFAMQLHDDLAQSLANLVFKTELVRRQLPFRREEIRKEIFGIREVERDVLTDLRELMFQLKTSQLKELDLVSTLRRYVEDFTRNYRLPVELKVKGKSKTFSSAYAFLISAVVREIFSNIAKHAHASRVSLHLDFKPKELKIVTRDNGWGFDFKKVKQDTVFGKKLGLFSIQKRVKQLKGKLTITTGKDKGTKITFTSPYK